jgi:hypothetical protein
MILGGSNKFNLNRKSLTIQDINKIMALKIDDDDNKNAHLKYSLVYYASKDLNRFKFSFEIYPNFDYIADFTKKESIIEVLVEANKLKELVHLVNNIFKKNANQ